MSIFISPLLKDLSNRREKMRLMMILLLHKHHLKPPLFTYSFLVLNLSSVNKFF